MSFKRQQFVPAKRHPKDVSCALFSYNYINHLLPRTVTVFEDICVSVFDFDSTSLIQKDLLACHTSTICSLDNSHIAREDSLLKTSKHLMSALYSMSSSFLMFMDRFYVIFLTPLIHRTRDTVRLLLSSFI